MHCTTSGIMYKTMISSIFYELELYLERIDKKKDAFLFPWVQKHWPRDILPNHLTIARIIIGLFLFVFIFNFKNTNGIIILSLFFIGALTDLFDGVVARGRNQITKLGEFLDPVADRFLILPIAVYSLMDSNEFLLLFLLISEVFNALLSIMGRGKKIFVGSNIFGKAKMVLQSLVFIGILVFWPQTPNIFFIYLLWVSAICFAISILVKITQLKTYYAAKNL